MTMMHIVIFLTVTITIGGTILHIFLSKKENKWLGLILPLICIITSFIIILIIGISNIMNNYEVPATIMQMLFVLVISNIPTGILLAIYFLYRKKIKTQNSINKMNIRDLE